MLGRALLVVQGSEARGLQESLLHHGRANAWIDRDICQGGVTSRVAYRVVYEGTVSAWYLLYVLLAYLVLVLEYNVYSSCYRYHELRQQQNSSSRASQTYAMARLRTMIEWHTASSYASIPNGNGDCRWAATIGASDFCPEIFMERGENVGAIVIELSSCFCILNHDVR